MKSKRAIEFESTLRNDLARTTGEPPRWQDTTIYETPAAILTDPLGRDLYGGGSYHEVSNFPMPSEGTRRAIRSLERIASRQSKSASRGRRSHAMDSAPIRLDPHGRAREEVARLQPHAARNKTSHAWWQALWSYVSKFPHEAKIRDLDPKTVRTFLREI